MSFTEYLKEEIVGSKEWREKQIKMRNHRIANKIAEGEYEIETTLYMNGNQEWVLEDFPISFNLDCWGSTRGARSSLGVPEEPDEEAGCNFDGVFFQMNWEDAKKEYMQNNGHRKFLTDFRVLKWEPGRLETPWQGDTVAVGLSAGFIEPMEANGLSLLIHQIKTLSRVLNKPKADIIYNKAIAKVFDQVADFIWHHYACTSRQETSFWQHYAKLDGRTTLMKRIQDNTNLKTNMYPSYVYAYLAIYYGVELKPFGLHIPKDLEDNIYADAYMWSM